MGRKKLRLRVAEANTRAVRFYERSGFTLSLREKGAFGDVLIMEKGIELP